MSEGAAHSTPSMATRKGRPQSSALRDPRGTTLTSHAAMAKSVAGAIADMRIHKYAPSSTSLSSIMYLYKREWPVSHDLRQPPGHVHVPCHVCPGATCRHCHTYPQRQMLRTHQFPADAPVILGSCDEPSIIRVTENKQVLHTNKAFSCDLVAIHGTILYICPVHVVAKVCASQDPPVS